MERISYPHGYTEKVYLSGYSVNTDRDSFLKVFEDCEVSTNGELPPSGFGSALRRVREEKGLTQKALGEGAGVHPNTVARMERGEVEPSWQVVLAFAKALGVDCSAFSGCEDVAGEPAAKPAKRKAAKK
ncbi:MAG TPA: helix-turn-helix transcriptional regulator [Gemmataceae bacterium]|jgi:DNA-binding XRE family transcriptional regulator